LTTPLNKIRMEIVAPTPYNPFGVDEVTLATVVCAVLVTVRLAVLLADPAVGVCVVVTPDVVLGLDPALLLVTLKVTVQLPDGAIAIPMKLRAVVPAVRLVGLAGGQVPPTGPPAADIFTSVSVNAPPVNAEALLFDNVSVTVEAPPALMVAGLNALLMVGATRTVKVAVLLGAPAVVCVVVTPDVILLWTPAMLLVTPKITVQLPLAGRVMPPKLRAVAPDANEAGVVPKQVPVTLPPAALMLVRVSVKEAPVSAEALLFDRVRVTEEVPPD